MAQVATDVGVKKTRRTWDKVLISSFLAGAYIAFGVRGAISVPSGLKRRPEARCRRCSPASPSRLAWCWVDVPGRDVGVREDPDDLLPDHGCRRDGLRPTLSPTCGLSSGCHLRR
jgi:hypothetical protein